MMYFRPLTTYFNIYVYVCITLLGRLPQYQRGNKISPDSGGLKYEKEDPEILVDDISSNFPCFLGI